MNQVDVQAHVMARLGVGIDACLLHDVSHILGFDKSEFTRCLFRTTIGADWIALWDAQEVAQRAAGS